jgi:hypothetical protein
MSPVVFKPRVVERRTSRRTVRPIANYAELDEPGLLQRAGLSPEAQTKIGARRNATLAGPIKRMCTGSFRT